MRQFSRVCAFAACLCSFASPGLAIGQPVALSDLLAGGEIAIGPLTFGEFSYMADRGLPSAEEILVATVRDEFGDLGLNFSYGIDRSPGDPAFDGLLSYVVESSGPHFFGARLVGDPALNSGARVRQIIARIREANFVFARGSSVRTTDALSQGAAQQLMLNRRHAVETQINAGFGDGPVLSFFQQTYTIPEPSSVGLAVVAAVCSPRRRRM